MIPARRPAEERAARLAQYEAEEAASAIAWADDMVSGVISLPPSAEVKIQREREEYEGRCG